MGINETKQFMSMMDQRKSYILVNASETFYVHNRSTEIIYIGKSIEKYFMSTMDQWKSYILAKHNKTFYIHDVSTHIINIDQQTFNVNVDKIFCILAKES